MQKVLGNEVLEVLTIKRWCKMFLDGRELVEFEPQGAKLETMCTVTNINSVATTIEEDNHQSVQTLITELKISQESLRQISTSELKMKRVCSV